MKKIKINHYYKLLLLLFVIFYLGTRFFLKCRYLFLDSEPNSQLGFYGDMLNAVGTILGVLSAYFIMRIEISNNQNSAKKQEEKQIVLNIEKEFQEIQQSQLSMDLKLIKKYSSIYDDDKKINIAKKFMDRINGFGDTELGYREINKHMANIKSLGNHFPLENTLLESCDLLNEEWNKFYAKFYILLFSEDELNKENPDISDINNIEISNQADKLLNEYDTMSQKIDDFFKQSRGNA